MPTGRMACNKLKPYVAQRGLLWLCYLRMAEQMHGLMRFQLFLCQPCAAYPTCVIKVVKWQHKQPLRNCPLLLVFMLAQCAVQKAYLVLGHGHSNTASPVLLPPLPRTAKNPASSSVFTAPISLLRIWPPSQPCSKALGQRVAMSSRYLHHL